MTASFNIFSNSLFSNNPIIWCFIVWAADSIIKWIISKYPLFPDSHLWHMTVWLFDIPTLEHDW
jgi:hypothetical protein